MIIDIGITNLKESNEFLTSLWAEMAKEFGICGWHYQPYRNKQTKSITFGFVNIGVAVIMAGITYKNNGSIMKLYFGYKGSRYEYRWELEELKKDSELGQRLVKVVIKARKGMGKYKEYIAKPKIKSFYPLWSYEGESFKTEIIDDGITEITFPISAYDNNQVDGKIHQKTKQIMDFLAVETNVPFWKTSLENQDKEKETTILTNEEYQEPDFIDDISVSDGYLTISKEAKEFLNYIIYNNGEDKDLQIFLNACNHYHTARKYDAQIFDHQGYIEHNLGDGSGVEIESYTKSQELKTALITGGSQTEIATTLYMSALEVVTLIGFQSEKCAECNQDKFGVARRVRNIVGKYLNQYLAGQLNDYYNKRSKYLHRGYMLTNDAPTRSSVPLLDVDGDNGCKFPVQVSLINLREYASYVLRAFYKEFFLNNESKKEEIH